MNVYVFSQVFALMFAGSAETGKILGLPRFQCFGNFKAASREGESWTLFDGEQSSWKKSKSGRMKRKEGRICYLS